MTQNKQDGSQQKNTDSNVSLEAQDNFLDLTAYGDMIIERQKNRKMLIDQQNMQEKAALSVARLII